MTELKNMDTGVVVTTFVSLREKQEVIRTIHRTLDGSQLVSRFGDPAISYELTIYVKEAGKQALFTAENHLSLLRITIGDSVYYGRITELSDFERITREYFKAEVTLAKESDV